MARDGVTGEEALQRIQSQLPLSSKCLWADVEIDNSHDRATTRWQAERLVNQMNRISYCRTYLYYAVVLAFVVVFILCVSLIHMLS